MKKNMQLAEETQTVSIIDDWAFLLSDDPTAIRTLKPQALIHAVLPDTANRSKIMPAGSSYADVWMLKHGNPLSSVDAALYLITQAVPGTQTEIQMAVDSISSGVKIFIKGKPVAASTSETLPGALVIALLNYLSDKEKK
jgi:hypothetical protein